MFRWQWASRNQEPRIAQGLVRFGRAHLGERQGLLREVAKSHGHEGGQRRLSAGCAIEFGTERDNAQRANEGDPEDADQDFLPSLAAADGLTAEARVKMATANAARQSMVWLRSG